VRPTSYRIKILVVGGRRGDEMRGTGIVDRLAARRTLAGDAPEWETVYEARDATEAMRLCVADLEELDAGWFEVLDLRASAVGRAAGLPSVGF
jgi:hypothetical protein